MLVMMIMMMTVLSSLTILPRDSWFRGQSHEQLGKSHGKQIHKLIHPDADFSETEFLVR